MNSDLPRTSIATLLRPLASTTSILFLNVPRLLGRNEIEMRRVSIGRSTPELGLVRNDAHLENLNGSDRLWDLLRMLVSMQASELAGTSPKSSW